ncbi:MAG: DUF4139 domain-containing protein [Gemmatimonadota bacterium]
MTASFALRSTGLALAALGLAPLSRTPPAGEMTPPGTRSDATQRESVTVTVYNQNFGLVREVRGIELPGGVVPVEFADVASQIQAQTVHVRPLGRGSFRLLEQNYRYDLLSPETLLQKYVGRTVKIYRRQPDGSEQPVDAEVLAVNGRPVLRIDGEITFDVPGRFAFSEVPGDLIASPSLVWKVDAPSGTSRTEVSYLTGGLNWSADYVLVVDDADRVGDLTGWVTLTNQSGATFDNANLKLVAGDVKRVMAQDEIGMRMRRDALALSEVAAAPFSEEGLFEYHLYTMQRPTDLKNNEQKQVVLLEGRGFPLKKELVFRGDPWIYRNQHGEVVQNQKALVYLGFDNAEREGLGMPLPRGVVRVYKADASGAQQFIGEDRIDHTPRDEQVRIQIGEAFDVVGDRRQTDFEIIGSCVTESEWEISIRNHKDTAEAVTVIEPVGGDWTLVSSSHEAHKIDAWTFEFRPRVPANGEVTVRYRVRVRWC